MRVIIVPRRVLAWLALVLACAGLLWYGLSGPAAVKTGVVVHSPLDTPGRPHESGTPAPAPEETRLPNRSGSFAAETALERDRSRSARVELLRKLAADPATSAVTRDDVQRRLLDELDRAAKEEELQELLKAEGFSDAFVVLNDRGLTISVRGRLVDAREAARLGELASRMTGLSPERIVIIDGRAR